MTRQPLASQLVPVSDALCCPHAPAGAFCCVKYNVYVRRGKYGNDTHGFGSNFRFMHPVPISPLSEAE